jgi:PAS domain S-box-containing protein
LAVIHQKLDQWIQEHLFNAVPMGIAVIDQAFNLVSANHAFEQKFGAWYSRKCFHVYKNRDSICPRCPSGQTFSDGIPRVNEEVGYDKNGNYSRYIKHTIPIVEDDGTIPFLIEMSTDITEVEQIRREYQLLFDQVPCNILLIDKNFRIVKTNARVRQMVGNLEGSFCYQGLKGFEHRCSECTARETFEDGELHSGRHVWRALDGKTVHLHVITVPLRASNGTFDTVMEMAVDVTQTIQLESGLNFAHTFLETMVATSLDSIFAIDENSNLTIFNPAARRLFKIGEEKPITQRELSKMLPEGLWDDVLQKQKSIYLPESSITDANGGVVPVRLACNQLMMDAKSLGMAFSVQDLSAIRRLQNEKLEAERLAAVGQTVAGLAHGVKNLITALKGGMYMLNSGVNKGNIDRVGKGMEMLDRNIQRISMFVQAFLGFARGRDIQVRLNDPAEIALEVTEMYAAKAEEFGIQLRHELSHKIEAAPIDYESMHECLANLVGNAIDACHMSETTSGLKVTVRLYEKEKTIFYEVSDNGIGMEYEIKQKIFTTFFTTKGLGGTGLGLLMTKKNVQEHGGSIELETEPGAGTTFRIRLPRKFLPSITEEEPTKNNDFPKPEVKKG